MGGFDPDRLLAVLPRRKLLPLPAGTITPRAKSVGQLSDYNDFTGKERLRTFELPKWLTALGAMPPGRSCNICARLCDQQHAEDYYDLATWIDLCRSCHIRLHQRFRNQGWRRFLDGLPLAADHWARHISVEPFDLAALLRSRGSREPTFADFLPKPS